jgi:hypothetical protein
VEINLDLQTVAPLPASRPPDGPARPEPPRPSADDAIAGQRAMARRLAVSETERQAAQSLLNDGVAQTHRVADPPAARKALAAYDGVARNQELAYVSSILGIDERA